MTDDGWKPGWAFWTTISAITLVAYPLSIGPAHWLDVRGLLPECLQTPLTWFYDPILWLAALNADVGPHGQMNPFGRAIFWYIELWGK